MRKNEGRTIGLFFKVSPEEMELIEKKMEQAGTQNKRAYLRKMAVDGYIVRLDMESVKELCTYSFKDFSMEGFAAAPSCRPFSSGAGSSSSVSFPEPCPFSSLSRTVF